MPFHLQLVERTLFVSDWGSHKVFTVNVDTGDISSVFGQFDLQKLDLNKPRVLDFDSFGNMYLATGGSVCQVRSGEEFCLLQVNVSN